MSEGPTTVGSINAYLDLDIDRFIAKAEEAKAVGDSIEGKTYHAKADIDTSSAAKAKKDIEGVNNELKKTQQQAPQAQGALIGALVAVSAAAPPVAAAAIGITGAMGAMGAAGVLALGGILHGLKDNTLVGQQYRGVIGSLTTDLRSLQDSAAKGLLPGVQASATVLNQQMPALNAEVQHFAGMLGDMMPTGLHAVITLLERAQPLFDASGVYLQHLVTGLDSWASGNGFQQFLDYAIQNLPNVEHLLGSLGHLVVDFLTAWAPLGSTTLPMLTTLVTALDDIVRATGPLAPAIIVGIGAFNALKPVIGIIQGVTTALKAMTVAEAASSAASSGLGNIGGAVAKGGGMAGLLGVAGLAGTALTAGMYLGNDYFNGTGLTKDSSQYAKSTGKTYVEGLNLASPIPGQGIKNLVGMTGFGRGLAQGPVGTFAQGNLLGDLMGVNNGVAAAQNLGNQDKALAGMVGSGKGGQAAAIFAQITAAAKEQGVSVSALKQLYPAYTAAVETAANANKNGVTQVNDLNTAYANQQAKMATAATNFQTQDSAANAARDAIANVTTAVKANGTSLDENTTKGRANAEAVSAAVVAIQAHGAAMVKAGHSTAEAAVSNDQMAISLEHSLERLGVSKKAAEDYVNKLMGIPKNRTTEAQLKIDKAKASADQAKQFAEQYAKGNYTGILKGNYTDAQKKSAQAALFSKEFAAGHYQAILKGDFTPAEKAAAAAKEKAIAYAKAKYEAALKADNNPANHAIKASLDAALAFARQKYEALLHVSSNASQAVRSAEAELQSVQDRNVTLAVHYVTTGQNTASGGAKYGPKIGGTVGAPGFGALGGFPGMAYGGSPGGSVSGPGHASSDAAGLYRLANGEEVISNLFGQADRWRPLLKAINAGRVDYRTFEQIADRMHARSSSGMRHTTIAPEIHVHNPVAVDPIQQAAEAAQLALAYAGLG